LIGETPDQLGLGQALLKYVAQQLPSEKHLSALVKTLEASSTLPSSPTARLLAFSQFAARDIWIGNAHVGALVAYSEVLEELLTHPRGFQRGTYGSLERQWSEYLLNSHSWHDKLPILSLLLTTEARASNSELTVLDFLSESTALVYKYSQVCADPLHDEIVLRIGKLYYERGHFADSAVRTYIDFAESIGSSNIFTLEAESLFSLVLSSGNFSPPIIERILGLYRDLFARKASAESRAACIASLKLVEPYVSDESAFPLLQTLLDLHASDIESYRVHEILGALTQGASVTPQQLQQALLNLLSTRRLEGISTQAVSAPIKINALLAGASLTSFDRSYRLPKVLGRRLQAWEEVHDLHRGFTSRLAAAQRTPFRDPPDLVQFATDVGDENSVRYINAKSPNDFPGKGFLLTPLKFAKCFAPAPGKTRNGLTDPFGAYRVAWPQLSRIFGDFDKTEFLFLRGLLAISCKTTSYNTKHPDGTSKHYALVVFNDHFRNPFQEVAYLVPTEGLKQLVTGAQVQAADFVGFDQRRKDVTTTITSPRDLLQAAGIAGWEINVASLEVVVNGPQKNAGYEWLAANAEHSSQIQSLEMKLREYQRAEKAWSEKSRTHQNSPLGLRELNNLERQFAALPTYREQLASLIDREVEWENSIWTLVDKYVALHKLFCIAHAYWHRGYTAGSVVKSQHISLSNHDREDELLPAEPVEKQSDLKLHGSSDAPINRNALRMLIQAYELHSQRMRNPAANRSDFKILVVCDATKTGVQPPTDLMLDTYDMTVTMDGKKFQLTPGGMTSEDESFWISTFFPRVKDEPGLIKDLRFYPRQSLEIE
jgi:hypothetical protein